MLKLEHGHLVLYAAVAGHIGVIPVDGIYSVIDRFHSNFLPSSGGASAPQFFQNLLIRRTELILWDFLCCDPADVIVLQHLGHSPAESAGGNLEVDFHSMQPLVLKDIVTALQKIDGENDERNQSN